MLWLLLWSGLRTRFDDERRMHREGTVAIYCRHRGKKYATCGTRHTAGVICRLNKPYVRLVGSPLTHAGIVQIRHHGRWGTICVWDWEVSQGHVVCRELGFRRALFTTLGGDFFDKQTGPVWLNEVTCAGNESSIWDCDLEYAEDYECDHEYDSGVICESNKNPGLNGTAEIRLQGSNSSHMGRVEIHLEGFWGALCSVGWDKNDADVVCRQLGYPEAVIDVGHGEFGSTSPVWLTIVRCQGNETSLDQCLSTEWIHEPKCWLKHGAGVICKMDNITGDGDVRLLGADKQDAGRVEVQLGGIWGGVSDEDWDLRDGHVVCRQLGYLRAAHVFSHSRYGTGNGTTWLTGLQCTGKERNILDCPRQLSSRIWAYFRQLHKAAVQCTNETHFPSAVEVRLIGMNLSNAGHVQVRYNGTWGTICAPRRAFNYGRATVICRQLHMGPPAKHSFTSKECTAVNQGAETVWLSNLNCQGFEESIDQCPHRGWGRLDPEYCGACTPKLCSVCLICQPARLNTSDFTVRLAGSNRLPYAGRVEVRHAGVWGLICPIHMSGTVYRVICRQLGFDDVMGGERFYGPESPRIHSKLYGEAEGPVWLSKVHCHGNESHLSQCNIHIPGGPMGCAALELMCLPRNFTQAYPIRLTGTSVLHAGRLEMFYNGSWGTVCGHWTFRSTNAMVACRQLGFGLPLRSSNSWSDNCPSRGKASSFEWLDRVKCRGNESSLDQCLHGGLGQARCYEPDMCLVCDNSQYRDTEIAVQLIGSQVPYAGRVKVRYQGVWGTLCKDDWETETAKVLCRQLGYKGVERENFAHAIYGGGPGPVWFKGDRCHGNEKTLSECAHQELYCFDDLVQLVCQVDNVSFTDFPVKLTGSKPDEGRVEVFYGGLWGSVSAMQWDLKDAKVLCRQLGYTNNTVSTYNRKAKRKRLIWFQKFHCRGDEQSLGQCAHSFLAKSYHPYIEHTMDVFVRCTNDSVIATGPSPSTQVLRASPTSSHVTPAISPVTTPASSPTAVFPVEGPTKQHVTPTTLSPQGPSTQAPSCHKQTCKNGGTCEHVDNTWACQCLATFAGADCAIFVGTDVVSIVLEMTLEQWSVGVFRSKLADILTKYCLVNPLCMKENLDSYTKSQKKAPVFQPDDIIILSGYPKVWGPIGLLYVKLAVKKPGSSGNELIPREALEGVLRKVAPEIRQQLGQGVLYVDQEKVDSSQVPSGASSGASGRDSDELESGGKRRTALIVLGVLLGVVCLVAIVAVVLYIRKRNRNHLSLTKEKKSGQEDEHIQLVSL